MPDTPRASAGRNAANGVSSEIVDSISGAWMRRRNHAISHATTSPTAIPAVPTHTNRGPAATKENVPLTAAATAMR